MNELRIVLAFLSWIIGVLFCTLIGKFALDWGIPIVDPRPEALFSAWSIWFFATIVCGLLAYRYLWRLAKGIVQ